MKIRNTLSKSEYMLYNLMYAVLISIWYNNLFFRNALSLSRFSSKCLFFAIVGVCLTSGIIRTWKYHRNFISLGTNLLFPFGLYSLLTYFSLSWLLVIIPALALCVLYCAFVLKRKITSRAHFKQIMKSRLSLCCLASRSIIAVALTAAFLPVMIRTFFGNSLFIAKAEIKAPSKEGCTIEENLAILSNLKPVTWNMLSETQKLDTLQTVANIEAKKLGLPHELTVTVKPLPVNVAAYYNDNDHSIAINLESFDESSSGFLLDSVCHEAYHALQHRLCELYDKSPEQMQNLMIFDSTKHYIKEFEYYSDGSDDFTLYYSQHCETDAREYACKAQTEYFDKIYEEIDS